MATTTKTTTPGIESIDRLEEKIKLLVNTIVRIKGEQTRVAEENGKLKRLVADLTLDKHILSEIVRKNEKARMVGNHPGPNLLHR